ncbi:MAG TPA: MBL fold metallo-hydrolase, partial [Fimbriimonadaceae bacterium]|nr:MBL fold metallo-hydrolase [Fimbriimonadaceae bacterium]
MLICAALGILMTTSQPHWELIVLGVAQDAGFPQLGCEKACCVEKRKGKPERVSCIGVRNPETGESILFDATPDMPAQIQELNGGVKPTGVFLTHGHIGHYTGLMYFGRESADWKGVPTYGSAKMYSFLDSNQPWKALIDNKNLDFHTIEPDKPVKVAEGLEVTAMSVPHRHEFTDTFGFVIKGPHKSAVFIPDIDRWEQWDRDIRTVANENDYLILDGTFSSPAEVGGRDISQIPHPMIPVTRALLKGCKGAVWFIHLNHTNPAY